MGTFKDIIPFIILSLAALLSLRSIALLFFEKKGVLHKIFQLGMALLFSVMTLSFFSLQHFQSHLFFKTLFFLLLSLLLAIPLIQRLKTKKTSAFRLSFFKSASFALFFLIAFLFYIPSAFIRLSQDLPILKITMTGQTLQKEVEWKNPQATLQKRALTCFHIRLSTLDEKITQECDIYGDLFTIRAKVLRFHPFLNYLGLDNRCQIDTLYNGYRKSADYQQLPIESIEWKLPSHTTALDRALWALWNKLFYNNFTSLWVKSASLESTYFPLTDSSHSPYTGSFYLTLTMGGLSSMPIPAAKKS